MGRGVLDHVLGPSSAEVALIQIRANLESAGRTLALSESRDGVGAPMASTISDPYLLLRLALEAPNTLVDHDIDAQTRMETLRSIRSVIKTVDESTDGTPESLALLAVALSGRVICGSFGCFAEDGPGRKYLLRVVASKFGLLGPGHAALASIFRPGDRLGGLPGEVLNPIIEALIDPLEVGVQGEVDRFLNESAWAIDEVPLRDEVAKYVVRRELESPGSMFVPLPEVGGLRLVGHGHWLIGRSLAWVLLLLKLLSDPHRAEATSAASRSEQRQHDHDRAPPAVRRIASLTAAPVAPPLALAG